METSEMGALYPQRGSRCQATRLTCFPAQELCGKGREASVRPLCQGLQAVWDGKWPSMGSVAREVLEDWQLVTELAHGLNRERKELPIYTPLVDPVTSERALVLSFPVAVILRHL